MQTTALITGANRGLGREFARQLRERGAKVYATARNPRTADEITLDIMDRASIEAAVRPDVNLLINNAGISTGTNLVSGDLAEIRRELDTHFWGTLGMIRAYAPVLAANGGGAILNVLSALSWFPYDGANAYSVAKAAEWSLTNAVRVELAGQGTRVTGLHLGAADTDMMAAFDVPKSDPAEIVATALAGLDKGLDEILADEAAVAAKHGLSQPSASNR
jgi:NAD(P)-dependent dehydrogenase (short-subunit alcohol dehydrogenase family)